MVHHFQAGRNQSEILVFIGRQETHIVIRFGHFHPVRFGRIEDSQRFRHIFNGIRVVQFLPQHDLFMGQFSERGIIRQVRIRRLLLARAGRHDRQQHGHDSFAGFHGSSVLLTAKVLCRIRFPPEETFICKNGLLRMQKADRESRFTGKPGARRQNGYLVHSKSARWRTSRRRAVS